MRSPSPSSRSARSAGAVLAMSLALVAAACGPPPAGGGGSGTSWSVDPSTADPSTTADAVNPNRLYLPIGAPRGALAVILHGTGAGTSTYGELTAVLRKDGYHVIVLRYSSSPGTFGACPDSVAGSFPDCHRVYRSETVFGAGVTDPDGMAYDHPGASISGTNSVVNRLLKLIEHMTVAAPSAGWGQFQDATGGVCDSMNVNYGACDLDWSKVAVVGHSQGAGVALYMAKFFNLRAAGLLSGSYDAFQPSPPAATAAPWTTGSGFATPASSIRVLRHSLDYGTARILAVADAVGVPGPEHNVTAPPFTGNRLVSSAASTCPWDSAPHHNSTAFDLCAPNGLYDAAWRELAGS